MRWTPLWLQPGMSTDNWQIDARLTWKTDTTLLWKASAADFDALVRSKSVWKAGRVMTPPMKPDGKTT